MQKTATHQSPRSILIAAFLCLFLIVMVLHSSLLLFHNALISVLLAAAILIFLVMMHRWISSRLDAMSHNSFTKLLILLAFLYGVVNLIVSNQMAINPPSDTIIIYRAMETLIHEHTLDIFEPAIVECFPNSGISTYNDYLVRCSNNLLLFWFWAGNYWIANKLGLPLGVLESSWLAITITSVLTTLSCLYICLLIRRITNRNRMSFLCAILCVLFIPFILCNPNFYTDILVLFPTMCAIYHGVVYDQTGNIRHAAIAAFAFSFAAMMKPTALIMVIALFIVWMLWHKTRNTGSRRFRIKLLLVVGAAALIVPLTIHGISRFGGAIDYSREDEISIPSTMFLLYGSHGDGAINQEDLAVVSAVATPGERVGLVQGMIRENYESFSPAAYLKFVMYKQNITWNDGSFEAFHYLEFPLYATWTLDITQKNGDFRAFATLFVQGILLMLTLGTCISAVRAFSAKQPNRKFLFFCHLCIFGVMLYLQFFETAPRRALIAVPFLIFSTAYAIDGIGHLFAKKSPSKAIAEIKCK